MLSSEEPKGWPLNRPITTTEWAQVLKLMALRRLPEGRSMARRTLEKYLQDDISATLESGKLYLEPTKFPAAYAPNIVSTLIRDGILREGMVGYDPLRPSIPVMHLFRSDTTGEYLSLVPKHIDAVLNFFPVTNELELLASLFSDGSDDLPKIEPEPQYDLFGRVIPPPF